jgi:hypothetical protein
MPDVDDVRGVSLALLHAAGTAFTIVGVPLLAARRLVRGRRALVVPVALGIGAALTVATRRTGWNLVKLWLGIDRPRGERQSSGR